MKHLIQSQSEPEANRASITSGFSIAGHRILGLLLIAGLAGSTLFCQPQDEHQRTDAEYRQVISEASDLVYGIVSIERYNPPSASRVFAYSKVGLYEGWVHGVDELESLAGRLNGLDELPQPDEQHSYDWLTSALTAQYEVSLHLFEGIQPHSFHELERFKDDRIQEQINRGGSQEVIERSEAYGRQVAEAIIEWAQNDGYTETRTMVHDLPEGEGVWEPTADFGTSISLTDVTHKVQLFEEEDWRDIAEADRVTGEMLSEHMLVSNRPDRIVDQNVAMEPHWGELRPLALEASDQFQPPDPAPYSEDPDSEFYEQAMAVYEESQDIDGWKFETAYYWSDNIGETGTPAGHWLKIMNMTAEQHELSFEQTLQLITLGGIAMADAYIACWHEKFRTNVLRPVTYIREHIEDEWVPAIVTPPFPEYTAGHATVSHAAAQTMTGLLGELAFTDYTHTYRYGFEPRSYDSFLEAAGEAGRSRLYGGIHYPMGIEWGNWQGKQVGSYVVDRLAGDEAVAGQRASSDEWSSDEQ